MNERDWTRAKWPISALTEVHRLEAELAAAKEERDTLRAALTDAVSAAIYDDYEDAARYIRRTYRHLVENRAGFVPRPPTSD